MVRRRASKTTPPSWKKKPIQTNLISPIDARMTPPTMAKTLRRTFMLG